MGEPRRYSAEEIELILEKVMLNWHNNVYNHVHISLELTIYITCTTQRKRRDIQLYILWDFIRYVSECLFS